LVLSDVTPGATIFYGINGSAYAQYTGPISLTAGTYTVSAYAAITTGGSVTSSPAVSATYIISTTQVAPPTFNPAGGTYSNASPVMLSDVTPGASISYSINGSAWAPYTSAISLSAGTYTVYAYAAATIGGSVTFSAISSATYIISTTQVAPPTFNPGSGTYSSAPSVMLSDGTPGSSISYSINGSAWAPYTGAISLSAGTYTVYAYAVATIGGSVTLSAVSSATYIISTTQVASPTFNPGSGTYSTAQTVAISTPTPGAFIRYTTDGSMPSETAGTLYSGSITINSTTTITAIAYEGGMTDSAIASATYNIGVVNRSLSGSSGNGFHALALASAQTGTFTATFDATPSASPDNAVVGLSKGAATAYGSIACIARFNPSGQIDAYNHNGYVSTTINYLAGVTYHFRMVVNVPANTYSVYVTPAGGSELTVGLNYGFRTAVTSLDTWDLDVNAAPAGCSLTADNLTP
jgi:hypothetical protein